MDTPAVLSVGYRCMHQGYTFIWLAGKAPCMITPEKVIIPLDVIGDVPYLKDGGLYHQHGDQSNSAALTGVRIDRDGCIVIDPEYLGNFFEAAPAAPGAGLVEEGVAEPSSGSADHSVDEKASRREKHKAKKVDEGVVEAESTTEVPTDGDVLDDDDSEGGNSEPDVVRVRSCILD